MTWTTWKTQASILTSLVREKRKLLDGSVPLVSHGWIRILPLTWPDLWERADTIWLPPGWFDLVVALSTHISTARPEWRIEGAWADRFADCNLRLTMADGAEIDDGLTVAFCDFARRRCFVCGLPGWHQATTEGGLILCRDHHVSNAVSV